MVEGNNIQYLQSHEIDRELWDKCIENADNGLIYATSNYLDNMARHWDAIIIDNFKAIMPLTWNIKYGIKYVYPPPFTQQLGLFYSEGITANVYEKVLNVIHQKFKFGEYYFNFGNQHNFTSKRSNFTLSLKASYDDIKRNYKRDLTNNIKKAQKHNLIYRVSTDYIKAINVYKEHYKQRTPHVTISDYNSFSNLCFHLNKKQQVLIREVVDQNENLLAITLCLLFKSKIYVLLSTTTNGGRKKSANHFLFDELIKEFSSQNFILDFEGSEIPEIAHFYKNFGSINETYFFYRWNHLPPMIAWLKN